MFGASLLSATASLPLHVMPLLVVAVAAEGRLPLAQAGAIASAYMIGQMVTALGLPALRFWRLTSAQAIGACLVMVAAVLASGYLESVALLATWWMVGAACGALQFLAATTATASTDRRHAFAQRLVVTLVVSGLAIIAVQAQRGFGSYHVVALQLSLVIALLMAAGLGLYRAPLALVQAGEQPKSQQGPRRLVGLGVVFLLFVGMPGFWAYAVQGAQQRGVAMEHMAYGIALCKILGGIGLWVTTRMPPGREKASLAIPGLMTAVGVAGMATAQEAIAFTLALLAVELGLNVLSARLQAAVVQDNPAFAGPWLAGAIFLGAATGPLLHGLAIHAGVPVAFQLYAVASTMIPVAWIAWRHRTTPNALAPAR
jgi:hypothetical protein